MRHAFPDSGGMPWLFDGPTLSRRGGSRGVNAIGERYCLGCQFVANVQRWEAGDSEDPPELLGTCGCLGHCWEAGLLGLDDTRRSRLQAAVQRQRYTRTEWAFIRWGGALEPGDYHLLQGLWSFQRDGVLRWLMGPTAPAVP